MFSVQTKTQSQRFQIPSLWGARFQKNSVFVIASLLPHAVRNTFVGEDCMTNPQTVCVGGYFGDGLVWTVGLTGEIKLRF